MRAAAACLALAAVFLPALPAAATTPLHTASSGCLSAPTTSVTTVPWAQQQLAPQNVWPLTNGRGVVVGVVDTGVDASTPQLAGRVETGVDVIDPGGGPADTDCFGHGTFVAGIIAAAPLAGTAFTGIAPDATILPVRAATSDGDVTADSLAEGIRVAVDHGAAVINVSASTTASDANLAAAVNYAEAHNVVLVAAAGNNAQSGDPVTYPADYPTVLAVGAVDSTGAVASFSETGPFVDLVAPGVNVVSIGPGGPGQWQGSGTSYAAPMVAATAALVRAYRPWLTAAQVRHRLEATADHPATTLPSAQLGWGTVNPMAAVSAVLPEEGGHAAVVAPPPLRRVDTPASAGLGRLITALVVVLGVLLVSVLAIARRVGPAGQRRGWRRGRVAVVEPDRSGRVGSRTYTSRSGTPGEHV